MGSSMEQIRPGIYRRPSGKLVVPIYDPHTGKKRWSHPDVPKGGFDKLKDAQAFKDRMEREKRERGSRTETCDSFAKRWPRDFPRPQQTTNASHRERVKAFAQDFKGVPLNEVTRPMARLWIQGGIAPPALERLAKTWKGAKVEDGKVVVPEHRQRYKYIRAMFNDAIDDELLTRNPFSALGIPEGEGRSDILVLTSDELDLLVASAEGAWGDFGRTMVGPMILIAAGTGMRPGELYAMRWHWIDWEAEEIRVKRQLQSKGNREEKPKGGKERTLALLPFVRAALQGIPRRTDDDHVFWTQSGTPMTQRTHWYYWHPVRTAFWAQLPKHRQDEIDPGFDFYELRHYFGSFLAGLQVSPYDIADQMGHVDGGALAMKRYIHTRSEDARERIKAAVREAQKPGKAATG